MRERRYFRRGVITCVKRSRDPRIHRKIQEICVNESTPKKIEIHSPLAPSKNSPIKRSRENPISHTDALSPCIFVVCLRV